MTWFWYCLSLIWIILKFVQKLAFLCFWHFFIFSAVVLNVACKATKMVSLGFWCNFFNILTGRMLSVDVGLQHFFSNQANIIWHSVSILFVFLIDDNFKSYYKCMVIIYILWRSYNWYNSSQLLLSWLLRWCGNAIMWVSHNTIHCLLCKKH